MKPGVYNIGYFYTRIAGDVNGWGSIQYEQPTNIPYKKFLDYIIDDIKSKERLSGIAIVSVSKLA